MSCATAPDRFHKLLFFSGDFLSITEIWIMNQTIDPIDGFEKTGWNMRECKIDEKISQQFQMGSTQIQLPSVMLPPSQNWHAEE